MGLSVKHACIFMLKDSCWLKKVLLGGCIVVFPFLSEFFPGIKRMMMEPDNIATLIMFIAVSVVLYSSLVGYFYKTLNYRLVKNDERLPDWNDFWSLTVTGFKATVGSLLFYLPFVALSLIAYYFIQPDIETYKAHLICCFFFIHLVIFSLYLLFMLSFSTDLKITSFLNWKRAIIILKNNFKNYVFLILSVVAMLFTFLVVASVMSLSGLATLFLPFLTFYVFIVCADLFVQVNKKEAV